MDTNSVNSELPHIALTAICNTVMLCICNFTIVGLTWFDSSSQCGHSHCAAALVLLLPIIPVTCSLLLACTYTNALGNRPARGHYAIS